MVISNLYMMKIQCPQSNCSSQVVEQIKVDKGMEYFKCMRCNFRFAVWEITGLQVIKR